MPDSDELIDLIRNRITKLRPRLLDLSRRNPLIKTSMSQRSNAIVRVVDEVPENLADALRQEERLRLVPLPPLESDPRDEQTKEFQTALADARRTDEAFLAAVALVDQTSDAALEQNRRLDRELRDRIRTKLGLSARVTAEDVSLTQHAKNNGIAPSYDLPRPTEAGADGRHADTNIQTLFLPEDLERKLNGLTNKCRTWQQETGINVLHAAFGFVEWTEPGGGESAFAPLLLLPLDIEKTKTPQGAEFWVSASGEELQTNLVLAEKLRTEFNIALPKYIDGSLEAYFQEVDTAAPPTLGWRVRRQVAFGVFPSARLAMFHDLAPDNHDFAGNEVIANLFGGAGASGATPFADEYEIDKPEIESQVPCLVMDADSSQFSTIVDIAQGKNLSVEGPPGTGKSQTIVNTIAAAITSGKKVLFVAEKTAALDVVKSRLEAVGLGPYILPLQAERSNRKQIATSLKERLEMDAGQTPPDYQARIDRFKAIRSELAEYISAIAQPFGRSGLSVYDVIGKSLVGNQVLEGLPRELQRPEIRDIDLFDRTRIEELRNMGIATEQSWREANAAACHWSGVTRHNIDKFGLDELTELARDAASHQEKLQAARANLSNFSLPADIDIGRLERIRDLQSKLQSALPKVDRSLLVSLSRNPHFETAVKLLQASRRIQAERSAINELVRHLDDPDCPKRLLVIREQAALVSMETLDLAAWRQAVSDEETALVKEEDARERLGPFMAEAPQFSNTRLDLLNVAGRLVSTAGRGVLFLRLANHSDPAIDPMLRQACLDGQDLVRRREELQAVFAQLPDMAPGDLLHHARSIRGAGFFARFGKKFQESKRFYTAHAREKFDRQKAPDQLQKLADWRAAELAFREDKHIRNLFGDHFKGIETDFVPFMRLGDYYAAIELELGGVGNRPLRTLLRVGKLDIVSLLADAPEPTAANFAVLTDAIAARKARRAKLIEALAIVSPLVDGLVVPAQTPVADLEALAARVSKCQRGCALLDAHEQAPSLFGDKWLGWKTDAATLINEVNLAAVVRNETALSGLVIDWIARSQLDDVRQKVDAVLDLERAAAVSIDALRRASGVDGFSGDGASVEALKAAAADREGLLTHSRYQTQRALLQKHGWGWLIEGLEQAGHALEDLGGKIDAVIYRAMAIAVYARFGATLAKYSGVSLDERRARLAALDREIIKLSRDFVRKKVHASAKPPAGIGTGKRTTWTDLALIQNEAAKQQAHISLRELNERAGRALRELKPCWMMSPLAVAQYLPAGEVLFDLCIIDEASQMPPEDAIGALSRCRQAMIVGDTNQLPPTSFFRKMFEDDDVDEDEAVSEESILELANATFRPARRLRWHYRSRHSGLIQFSNEHIYGGNLVVFPSASEHDPHKGVKLVRVQGLYKSSVNPVEAATMVDAIVQFMRNHPGRSLGVVTLNQKQRDLIQEEWDLAVARNPHAAAYVERWGAKDDGLEEFFIKNLENVQGDERDVIFIGTVYGPEAPGRPVMQRFGPINGNAGRRRLNVLFSRAKEQIVTFSSMTAGDITADENGNVGAYMLRQWLEYSATGVIHGGTARSGEPDSDFEGYVIEQLKAMGCIPVSQVGVVGYSIDIGVKHPAWPHGYILAVECDGATYHSARSARDRDRLRQQVLEGLGWRFHRIWSTDWFNDPRKEVVRLRAAVEARLQQLGVQKEIP